MDSMNHNKKDLQYMSSVSEAMAEQAPRGASALLWAMLLFIVIAIFWATWAELDEITRGDGEIIPSSQLQVIETLEGGAVSEILVKEGDIVEKGQVLLRIDDIRFSSSLKENQVRQYELIAKAARLKAESDNVEFISPEGFPEEYQSMIEQEKFLFSTRKEEMLAGLGGLEQQVAQRGQELKAAKSQEGQLQRSYSLLKRELDITRPLLKEGVISEVEFLRLKRQLNDLLGELSGVRLNIPRIESTLQETKQKLGESELQFRNEARRELNEVGAEVSRIKQALTGMNDRIDRAEVKAPVKGTVKQLLVNTVEGVVQPGDELLNIIPWEDTLLVEAKIRPSDIANIAPGQKAVIKVSAYDFSIYGGVGANVVFISPSTILDEEGESHYLVRLETEQPFLGTASTELPLMAGMTVGVDILTGKKTVMDYLLKPVLKAKNRALTER
ncbi:MULTISPECIES: HlyD family type I secretion periplasmic adaptor subunit [unclassified Neptuniibacter]|uniref:HlyD family type I secretion periplasmic adaptor subunit n=1 Tax=unclassified Neptuniibacter TaxID=2630693 RepID=UPI0025F7405E|nr:MULTISPECIES: HlyD family type I secretion periplasmic adaptor subunit [unclassified Neptuniibacter]|tara:strand:+ start:16571 stop:17899 length:1329 start_codon:yes stop_codon:yes gene_type:complete